VALVLAVYSVVFTLLAVGSGFKRSATVDEPTHLVAGYLALAAGDYRLDPTHPPLIRLWAALPWLGWPRVGAPSAAIDRASSRTWLNSAGPSDLSREYLFSLTDADQRLNTSRLMIVALGVGLGYLVFFWAYEWRGLRTALCALVFYTLSPGLLAHATLVTTDLGAAALIFAAVYMLWRTCRRASAANVAALAACAAAAVLTKFSAIILGPIVLTLVTLAVWRRAGLTAKAAVVIVAVTCAVTVTAVWAVYGWRYAPSDVPGWIFDVSTDAASHAGMPVLGGVVSWIDAHHLLPNAFTQGVLSCAIGSVQPAYLLGRVSDHGFWYYFPVAFLVKTPVPFIALVLVGAVTYVTHRRHLGLMNEAFVILPVGMYLAVAMVSGVNIGVRHILPLKPFLVIVAGVGADRLLAARHWTGRTVVAGLVLGWTVSLASAYPHTLTFFNMLAGGPEHGLRYLADSNLDWGQHLKLLKAWMDEHDVKHINLAYFGQADPQYYGIDCTYLPTNYTFASRVAPAPTLPGFVAISATVLSGVYLDPQWRVFYSGFRHRQPTADVGHSIRVYWVDHWPEADDTAQHRELGGGPDTEAALANQLLFNLRWPRLAAVHYRHYLGHRPTDSMALANYGTALEISGDVEGGVQALQTAVALSPQDASLHVSLGLSLITARKPAEAEAQARQAIALTPDNAPAFDLLGQACALERRFAEAAAAFQHALALDPSYGPAREDLERMQSFLRGGEPDRRPHVQSDVLTRTGT
jgi:4-amino-4-deoxy-L-arabinose transferase-like glycosyltransferase